MKSVSMLVKLLGLRLVSWVVSLSLPPLFILPFLSLSLPPCLPPPLCPSLGAFLSLPLTRCLLLSSVYTYVDGKIDR